MSNLKSASRFINRIFNQHDLSVIDELVSPNFHWTPSMPVSEDADGLKQYFEEWINAYPGSLRLTVERETASDQNIILNVVWAGTFTGSYFGMPGNGNSVELPAVFTFEFDAHGISKMLHQQDNQNMRQQLGV